MCIAYATEQRRATMCGEQSRLLMSAECDLVYDESL